MKYRIGDRIKIEDDHLIFYDNLRGIQNRNGFLIVTETGYYNGRIIYGFAEDHFGIAHWMNVEVYSDFYQKYLRKPKQFKLK
jgi:hypothetical protein